MSYNKHNLLHLAFEEAAEKYASKCAVIVNGIEYTYNFINRVANYYSYILVEECGICSGDGVVIYDDFTIESIISILAILKAGGAYIPINPEHPVKRNLEIIKESRAKVIISSSAVERLDVDIESYILVDITNQRENNEDKNVDESSTAYIIYTSGSTGIPKGVSISHRNIVSHIKSFNQRMGINDQDKFLGLYSMNVDASVEQLFSVITVGGTFVLCNREQRNDIVEIEKIILKELCTILGAPPILLKLFNQKGRLKSTSLRLILTGGDILKYEYIDRLLLEYSVMNGYGVTEASISSSWHKVLKNEREIPIGKPLNGVKIYIVDENKNVIQNNSIGEIAIAGDSVSEVGYINNEKENKKRFGVLFDQRVYYTGDLGKYDCNNNLFFCGRKDSQLEIDGHRIEPKEIEINLCKNAMIEDAFVCKEENQLKAYIVSKQFDLLRLREDLSKSLPGYMMPSEYFLVDFIPRNDMGKVKEYELRAKNQDKEQVDIIELNTKIQKEIAQIWRKILNRDISIGLNTNFYSIGGTSILLMELLYEMKERFDVNLTIKDLLNNLEIQEMERLITEEKKRKDIYIKTNNEKYPLTDIQKSIFFMSKLSGNGMYNNIGVFLLKGTQDLEQIVRHVKNTFLKNRVFKSRFHKNDFSECVIDNEKKVIFIKTIDMSNKTWIEQKNIYDQVLNREIEHVFDLEDEPLVRFFIMKISKNQSIILGNIHHIVIDGISWNILFKEIFIDQKDNSVYEEKFDYLDYANKKPMDLGTEKEFWCKELKSVNCEEYRIYDFKKPVLNFEGDCIDLNINSRTLEKIEEMASELKVSVNTIIIAAVYLLLYKYTGSQTIITGITYAGRNDAILQKIIGPFINMLPIKMILSEDEDIKKFIVRIKDKLNQCFENGEYPFEKMVSNINHSLNSNQSPVFQWAIDFIEEDIMHTEDFDVIPVSVDTRFSKYEINMQVYKSTENYKIRFEYCTGYFSRKYINELSKVYRKILENICTTETVKQLLNSEILVNKRCINRKSMEDTQILNIISKYTSKTDILESDTYSSLGISSLKLVEIAVDLEAAFGMQIRVIDLFGLKDIKDLINFVNKGTINENENKELGNRNKSKNRLSEIRAKKKEKKQVIVPISIGEKDNLVLLFSSMLGRTQEYSKDTFKELVDGIKSNSIFYINYDNKVNKKFQNLCQEIVESVEWNKYKKIILVGWCNGGYIAYRVAEMLEKKYQRIADAVVLLDCYHPAYLQGHTYLNNSNQEYLQLIQSLLKTMLPEDKSITNGDFINTAISLSKQEVQELVIKKLSKLFDKKTTLNLMNKYLMLHEEAVKEADYFFEDMTIHKSDIAIVLATSNPEEMENALGWEKAQIKKRILTEGNHLTMLSKPYVDKIIDAVNEILQEGK